MNVAELLVEFPKREGVTHIFGAPDEESEALLFTLEPFSIEFVPD